ncbi:MAG TPA: CPBP family intramembrane glutamic endopeptidase [Candidatus Angelobacter sp.]|nr:CPBP family intramembrane glutamic endopeptidase [Candidatus Angelobacter sp.]
MTLFDDNSPKKPDGHSDAPPTEGSSTSSSPAETPAPLLFGDPISYVAIHPASAHPPESKLPEDLRITWSWVHLLVFAVFFVATQFTIGTLVIGYYSMYRHLSQKQLRGLLESDPKLLVGTSILTFALIILFLYVTLAVLRGLPFWRTLGWKKLQSDPMTGKGKPWMYFLAGCGLSLFVAIASSRVKDAEHAPIQEFFKSRSGAMLLMAMAVFVAPLAEETIFRGYLYPVLARIISAIAHFFGMEFSLAIRTGVASSILLTGVLFGLMHGPQLGENWALVTLLALVGVIFTFARAWTGTVFASFLLHLGYNSMIAITSIIATKGFTQMPPHP